MFKRDRNIKVCPRCGQKTLLAVKRCHECGLIFARLDCSSNKSAKIAIKNKMKQNVIYSKKLPYDVSKKKLVLITIFMGIAGAHSFSVGRYARGVYSLICWIITISIILFKIDMIWAKYELFMSFFAVFGGVNGIMWLYDIVAVCTGHFKIPIAVDEKE